MKRLVWIVLASTSCMRVVHEHQLPVVETRDGPPSASAEADGPTSQELLAAHEDESDCERFITHVLRLKPYAPRPDPALGAKRCSYVYVAVRDCVLAARSLADFDQCNVNATADDCAAFAARYVTFVGADRVEPGEAEALRDTCQRGLPRVVVQCTLASEDPESCMDPMLRLEREELDAP